MPLKLYKTTFVVWSKYDPSGVELADLAHDATDGDSICSESTIEVIENVNEVPEGVLSFMAPEELDSKEVRP